MLTARTISRTGRTHTGSESTGTGAEPLTTLTATRFARNFAGWLEAYYSGVYSPGRVEAIRWTYAQHPTGQKIFQIELRQIAQILGRAVPGETVQNWEILLQQNLGGYVVPLQMCRAEETVDPVSRKCVAPVKWKPLPEPSPGPLPSEQKEAAAAGGGNTLLFVGLAALAVIFISGRSG